MSGFLRITGTLALLLSLGSAACSATPAPESAATADTTPPKAEELFQQGELQAQTGDHLRAEQYYLAAQRMGHPSEIVMPRLLAVCLSSGRLRTALGHAEPHLRKNPDHFVLRQLVGAIYLSLGDASRAHRELQLVESQAPSYAPTKYLLGVISVDSFGDEPGARRYFEQYLELDPKGPHAAEVVAWLREHPVKRGPVRQPRRRAS